MSVNVWIFELALLLRDYLVLSLLLRQLFLQRAFGSLLSPSFPLPFKAILDLLNEHVFDDFKVRLNDFLRLTNPLPLKRQVLQHLISCDPAHEADFQENNPHRIIVIRI